jgi:hypothetical protein
LWEETGLTADLSLCGTIIVDTAQNVGGALFIFRAENARGVLVASPEGTPEWIRFDRIGEYPLIEDVAIFLERIRQMKPGDAPFAGRSFYDQDDRLTVIFG